MIKQKTVRNFFRFLEQKRGEKTPTVIKILMDQERLTPEDLNIDGDLKFYTVEHYVDDLPSVKVKKLPDNLTIHGTLDLQETLVTELPKNLKVHGIAASGTSLRYIPDDVEFLNDLPFLYLSDTNIKNIPQSFTKYTFNTIVLRRTEGIRTLPENLKIVGSLDLLKSGIQKLPNGLKVGSLNILGTKVSEIPNDIVFDDIGNMSRLNCSNTDVRVIPNNIKKLFSLTAIDSKLEYIPDGLNVNSLDVRGTPFNKDSIPNNLKVTYLHYYNSNLHKTHNPEKGKELITNKGGSVEYIG